MKFCSSNSQIAVVEQLIESIRYNICRMEYNIVNANQQVEHSPQASRAQALTTKSQNRRKKLKEYLGHSLYIQHSLINKYFAMFQRKPHFELTRNSICTSS